MEKPRYDVSCPACQKSVPHKGLAKHASGCPQWASVVGIPVSRFNWDRYFKRGPYADGLVEGVDYVRCQECPVGAPGDRGLRILDHVKKVHGMTRETYVSLHPDASLNVPSTLEKRKATVATRYDGATNVFQVPEVKARIQDVMTQKYGGMGMGSAEIREQIEATNEARYGRINPFSSPEVQEKIRATNLERYNAENPNQSPEVIARRIATNQRVYGADHYFETKDFKDDYLAVSRERFGTDHPMQSEEGRALWESGCLENLGVTNPLKDPSIYRKTYTTNLANHGGKHSQQCPDVLAKARETWIKKYGTDNPSKVEAVKQKIKDVWEGKYGVPFPPQSLWTNQTHSCPNGLEKRVLGMVPVYVLYTGDKAYNVRLPGTSQDKYPDFVVLTPEQLEAYQNGEGLRSINVRAVIETFGDYWHGPKVRKRSREEHYNEVMDFYARCGVQCLILWEQDVNKRPAEVAVWIQDFLQRVAEGL